MATQRGSPKDARQDGSDGQEKDVLRLAAEALAFTAGRPLPRHRGLYQPSSIATHG